MFAVVGAVALAYAGMTCLAVAMERQHRQLRPGALQHRPRRARWRATGWISLALSLWVIVLAEGAGRGTTSWFGILSAVTLMLVLAIAYAPKWVFGSARLAAAVGLACLLGIVLV